MKTLLKALGALLVLLVVAAGVFYAWASVASGRVLARTFEAHTVDFAVPFPLTADQLTASGLTGEEGTQLAMARAVERGQHLVEARYACVECHGTDFKWWSHGRRCAHWKDLRTEHHVGAGKHGDGL